jgi:hypothetical protein
VGHRRRWDLRPAKQHQTRQRRGCETNHYDDGGVQDEGYGDWRMTITINLCSPSLREISRGKDGADTKLDFEARSRH